MPDLIQIKNPRSGRYVMIDRSIGIIVSRKETKGPYKNIPMGINEFSSAIRKTNR